MVNGLPPFPFVKETLDKLQGRADTMVVSATPAEALHREWSEHNIEKYVSIIAGQELGKKDDQLGLTARGKYKAGHILMVGDALGDLEAARSADAMFYPIVPSREEESWKNFHDVVMDQFLNGKYDKQTEERFLHDFKKALPKEYPWQQ
ncbi:MAG: HAD hydrolase-like protein [Bacteroidota bacterium]|nr:HAD hydrolase-like protein [Bacteroidota bacterium]